MRSDKSTGKVTLLARGTLVAFEMRGGGTIELPQDFAMLHDPANRHVRECTLVCCRCVFRVQRPHGIDAMMQKEAEKYFGSDAELVYCTVDLPRGPWKLLGDVAQVLYD